MTENIEKFTDLESIYSHLEKDAQDYKYEHQISALFQQLRDLKYKANELEEVKKAQWEIDFFNFRIHKAKLKSTFTSTNAKGEIVEYPSLDRFEAATYDYLDSRLNTTSNLLLKARYSNILWESPKKHTKYAETAIKSYLELVKVYESKDKKNPNEHNGLDVLSSIENAFAIACQIKYQLDETVSEIVRLVKKFNFESTYSFSLRMSLINLMLQNTRRFSDTHFVGINEVCWTVAQSLMKSDNIHSAIDMLDLGDKVQQRLGEKTHDWRRQIAENYELLMIQAEKNGNLASITFCQNALREYKKLKDNPKTSELENKYVELKDSLKLSKFETEIDLTEHLRVCREVAEKIVQNDTEVIIELLMLDKNLLPKYKDMEKKANEHSKEFVLQNIIPSEIFDQNGHTVQHFVEDDEKKYFSVLQQYQWNLELNKIYLINSILLAAIHENKLSANDLIQFLNKRSWFGKNIKKESHGSDEPITYNWLSLIAPALQEYFFQMHYYFVNHTNYPNLVLCIDSLTLKIEGLLRDLCRFSGVSTFYQTTDNKGRTIVQEKDIHALLYEEKIKGLFDEDDLLFFKFLLVEKAGYNLRHRVAHSLILFQEYFINYFNLLILALLRLGKYDFVKKSEAIPTDVKPDISTSTPPPLP